MRVGVYTRLSFDPSGAQTATQRQETACRAFADIRGWTIVDVFEDVDRSAYSGVVRPAYERLVSAVRDGSVEGILVWKLDRLVRRPIEFERLWVSCEKRGTVLASATEPIDSSTDLGLALVRILVAFAGLESATLSTRQRAAARQRAMLGKPPAGGARAYGLNRTWTAIIEHEAAMIREAAARVVAGETVASIAFDWRRRHVPGASGRPWRGSTLKSVLLSHRVAGDRAYRGELVMTDVVPAILDRETAEAVRMILLDPLRREVPVTSTYPYFLTGGLLRCGRCGASMLAASSGERHVYKCPKRLSSCAGVNIQAAVAEEHLRKCVLARLARNARTELRVPTSVDWRVVTDIVQVFFDTHHRIAADYRSGAITSGEAMTLRDELEREFARQRRDVFGPPPTRRLHEVAELDRNWRTMAARQRRDAIRGEVAYATVAPKARSNVNGERITILWHDTMTPGPAPRTGREVLLAAHGLLAVGEVADRLELSTTTVFRLIRRGELPAVEVGRTFGVTGEALDAYVASCRIEPGTLSGARRVTPRRRHPPRPRTPCPETRPPDLVSLRHGGAHAGVSAATIYRLIDRGDLPSCWRDRQHWVRRSDIDAYLERHRIAPGSMPYAGSKSRSIE